MIALDILKSAQAAGISVALDGTDPLVSAKGKPPKPILEGLREYKAQIVTVLARGSDSWSREDWQAFFDERAAIVEFDGQQPREQAEATAYECCIVEWLRRHPKPSNPDSCAWCGKPDNGHSVVPFGTEDHDHTWLHPDCWQEWHRDRREKAQRALAALGLVTPPGTAS